MLAVLVQVSRAERSRRLVDGQQRVERESAAAGELDTSMDTCYRDAFGRVLHYTERGAWKLRSYEIRSLGHDGIPSADDLCVSGGTRAAEALDAAVQLTTGSSPSTAAEQGLAARWQALSMSRCDDAKRSMNR